MDDHSLVDPAVRAAVHRLRQPLRGWADDQAAAFSRSQAYQAGYNDAAIAARLATQRWQRVHPGVYVPFIGPLVEVTEVWAALLFAGPGAAVRDGSALRLFGLRSLPRPTMVAVAVDHTRRVAPRTGIDVRRRSNLLRAVHPSRNPPSVRVEDAVLHQAAAYPSVAGGIAVISDACRERLTTPTHLRRTLQGLPRLTGRAVWQSVLDDVAGGAQSFLEVSYMRRVERAHGLPVPRRQVKDRNPDRNPGRVWRDGEYPEFGVIHELDGRLGHQWADDLAADRRRDLIAAGSGRLTLRHGYVDVFDHACWTAAMVGKVLQQRGWTGEPRRCRPECQV